MTVSAILQSRILYFAAAILFCIGLSLLAWSLWGDRKNRRKRRCCKCWYSMQGITGLRCPECGYIAKNESKLQRIRRRWGFAGLALLLLFVSAGIGFTPLIMTGRLRQWYPASYVIYMVDRTTQPWPCEVLQNRIWQGGWEVDWANRAALWDWQWRWLVKKSVNSKISTREYFFVDRVAQAFKYGDVVKCPSPEEAVSALHQTSIEQVNLMYKKLRIPVVRGLPEYLGKLEVGRIDGEFDGNPGKDCLLYIKSPYYYYQIIIFSQVTDGWKILGYADILSWYSIPGIYRCEFDPKYASIIIDGVCNGGTGFGSVNKYWLRINEVDGISIVCEIPLSGHTAYGGNLYNHDYQLTSCDTNLDPQGVPTITATYDYSCWYSGSRFEYDMEAAGKAVPEETEDLFVDSSKVVLNWDPSEKCFVVNPDNSDWTAEEFNTSLFEFSDADFITRFKKHLISITSGSDKIKKQWLDYYLDKCDDSEAKTKLLLESGSDW